ncbi:MAG: hypothetical protein H0T89_24950 [Deltaproteobacteria bacterium]|nr:hypothetical protein [Deltaproteobacteria bacterium]MDQ3301531.1 hypothetical protein [Myxococcota bacterium]
MTRVAAAVVSVVLIGATLSPLARKPADDGYPLSTYPMFAWRRPTKLTMSYPLGVTARGPRYLSPGIIGSFEVLQARAIVERAVAKGGKEVAMLCERIAARVATTPRFADVTAIRIVTGNHDAVDFLVRDAPGIEYERAACEVRRR